MHRAWRVGQGWEGLASNFFEEALAVTAKFFRRRGWLNEGFCRRQAKLRSRRHRRGAFEEVCRQISWRGHAATYSRYAADGLGPCGQPLLAPPASYSLGLLQPASITVRIGLLRLPKAAVRALAEITPRRWSGRPGSCSVDARCLCKTVVCDDNESQGVGVPFEPVHEQGERSRGTWPQWKAGK